MLVDNSYLHETAEHYLNMQAAENNNNENLVIAFLQSKQGDKKELVNNVARIFNTLSFH